jgi:hypothetical protein
MRKFPKVILSILAVNVYLPSTSAKSLNACDSPPLSGSSRAVREQAAQWQISQNSSRDDFPLFLLHPHQTRHQNTTSLPLHHITFSVSFQYAQRIFFSLSLQLLLHVRLYIATAVTPTAVHSLHRHTDTTNSTPPTFIDNCPSWLTKST